MKAKAFVIMILVGLTMVSSVIQVYAPTTSVIEWKYIWVQTYDASTKQMYYIDQDVKSNLDTGTVEYTYLNFRIYKVGDINDWNTYELIFEEEDSAPALKKLSWSLEEESYYSGKSFGHPIHAKVTLDSEIYSGYIHYSDYVCYYEQRFGFARVSYAGWPKDLLPVEGLLGDSWWGRARVDTFTPIT